MENEDVVEKKVEQVLGELLVQIQRGINTGDLARVDVYSRAFQRIITGVRS